MKKLLFLSSELFNLIENLTQIQKRFLNKELTVDEAFEKVKTILTIALQIINKLEEQDEKR